MIRIPLANEKTARIEIRSVAPDTNPYLALFSILKTGLEDKKPEEPSNRRARIRFLPTTISDAIRIFQASDYIETMLGKSPKAKYLEHKKIARDRNPRELGTAIKDSEVIYHHEITNQSLWNKF